MSNKDTEAVIISAVRTPSGSFQGGFSSLTAVDLGAVVVKAAVERAGIPNPADIKEVMMGNVVSARLPGSIPPSIRPKSPPKLLSSIRLCFSIRRK